MTRIVLLDFFDRSTADSNHHMDSIFELFNMMKSKMTLGRKSKKEWLENRMKIQEGYIPIEFYKDREYILESIKMNSSISLNYIANECFKDRQILFESLKALKNDNSASIPNNILKILAQSSVDREILKLLMELDLPWCYKFETSDKEMALVACICSNCFFKLIRNQIRKEFMEDEEFILSAIEGNHYVFEGLNENLQVDKIFIRKALERNAKVFNLLKKEFLQEQEFIDIVINQDPIIFEQQEILKINSNSAMLAVKKNGMVLKFLPNHYENYDEICREAIKQNIEAFIYSSDHVKNDRDLVLEITRKDGLQLCFASEELRNDPLLIQEVIQNYGFVHPDDDNNDVRQVIILTMKKFGFCADNPSIAFLNIDKEFSLEVVKISSDLVIHFPERLMLDKEVIMTAFEHMAEERRARNCDRIRIVDKDLMFEIFVKYSVPNMIAKIKNIEDFELVRKMIQHNGYAFSFIDEKFEGDPILIEEAWKQCGYVEYPSEEFYVKRMNYAYPELL